MAVGSGQGGQFAMKAESVFGTYAAPAGTIVGFLKSSLKFEPTRVQGGGLYAGETGPRDDRYVETTRSGSGTFTLEVSRRQLGLLLAQFTGSTTSPVQQAATTAYLQTHALVADQRGKSLTIQVGVPQTDGTVRAYTFLGSKIKKLTFSCGADELLTVDVEVDCRDLTEAQTLIAASWPTGAEPFHFKEMAVKLGTFGSEASVTGVRKVTVVMERTLKTDSQYAGAGGLKAEQTSTGITVSGTLEVDFTDKTIFVDKFIANTSTAMVLEWVGPIIASTFAYAVRFKLPYTRFTGDNPTLDGPDVVGIPIPFVSNLGTNGHMIAEYMSTDATV